MSPEKWLKQNTFYCPVLQARLTPAQCAGWTERKKGYGWFGCVPGL